jgi:hypothetical protein
MTEILGPWRQRISKDYEIDKKWAPEVMEFLQRRSRWVTLRAVYRHLQELEGYTGLYSRHLHTPADHILGWLIHRRAVVRKRKGRRYYYRWVPETSTAQVSSTRVIVTIITIEVESAK